MIKALSRAVLACDLPKAGLRAGDVGVVVDVLQDGKAYVLEFMTWDGETIAVEVLAADQIRELRPREIFQARAIA
jgi:hypothetical protein